MIRSSVLLVAASFLAAPIVAQLPDGGWVVGGGIGFVTYWSPGFTWLESPNFVGATSSSGGVAAVDGRRVIYTTDASFYYRGTYDPQLQASRRLVLPWPTIFTTTEVRALLPTTSELWSLDYLGRLYSVALSMTVMPTIASVVWPPPGGAGTIRSACTDGREVFFAVGVFDGVPGHPSLPQTEIYAVDLANAFARRLVAAIPGDRWTQLAVGKDGTVLAMRYDGLYEIDPVLGIATFVKNRPAAADFTLPSSRTDGQILMGYDPWTDVVAVGPSWLVDITHIESSSLSTPGGWNLAAYIPFFATLRKLSTASEQPFVSYGKGCLTSLGLEPRLGYHGLPLQGQSFDLKLRNAEPSGFSVFWVGQSDSVWPGVAILPLDTAFLGAPGCFIRASVDFTQVVATDATGGSLFTVTVPPMPALHGYEVYAQAACTSGGNVLGWAASDALAIRVR